MRRITDPITFNLYDRGRKYTGQDRSNVDVKQWIKAINSPKTQEMISTGGMLGYQGHQVRMLWGLFPPESVVVDGKVIQISPALRSVNITATEDGDCTHQIEFLDTPEGEYAKRQYKAKYGGFSMANDFIQEGGIIKVTEVGGFDSVLQPNFVHNMGNGLLDSAQMPFMVRQTLELSFVEMYDCIHATNHAKHMLDEALERNFQASEFEKKFIEEQVRNQRKEQLQKQAQARLLDSQLCPTVSFDDYLADSEAFKNAQTALDLDEKQKKQITPMKLIGGAFGFF